MSSRARIEFVLDALVGGREDFTQRLFNWSVSRHKSRQERRRGAYQSLFVGLSLPGSPRRFAPKLARRFERLCEIAMRVSARATM